MVGFQVLYLLILLTGGNMDNLDRREYALTKDIIRLVRVCNYNRKRESRTLLGKTKIRLLFALTLFFLIYFFASFVHANSLNIPNEALVNAIFKAEGGHKAQYLYGIRSIKYSNPEEARRICFNTVRNNKKRFLKYGYKTHKDFIEFLGSRYCPTKGNLSFAERKLNKHWVGNVKKFIKITKNNT